MSVLLVTCRDLPDGEPGAAVLDAALAACGIDASWVVWDDPGVDWAAADLVAVRSTWDYVERLDAFLAWSRSLDPARLLNGADVFAWNHDKSYLAEPGPLPVVPTRVATDAASLRAAVAGFGSTCVVKPAVGAGGRGLVRVDAQALTDAAVAACLGGGAVVVQPVVESVATRGEASVFVIDGTVTSQVDKVPAAGEVRVHEQYGGSSQPVAVDPAAASVAKLAFEELARRFGRGLDYLRVDLLWWEGGWVVSELEAIEPGLYLDITGANAGPFAALVASRAGAPRTAWPRVTANNGAFG